MKNSRWGNSMMFRRIMSFLIAMPFWGCGSKVELQNREDTDQGRRAELRFDDTPARNLPFKIVDISRKQKPTETEPFHTIGGEWTFLECQTENQQKFVVGIASKTTDEGTPSMWGQAVLAVTDNESGQQFVELFAKAFDGTVPPASTNPQPPKPLFINTAILGEDSHRDPTGFFAEKGGGWTATKWFPSNDLAEAEVYFNYNLNQKIGEFSEKDADYADSLVAIFAAALRDGPRPPRTPENDPNLSVDGPAIGVPRRLSKRHASVSTFTPNSNYAVFQDGTETLALAVNEIGGEPIQIAQFDYRPWTVHLINNEMDLLVQEGIQQHPGVNSSTDSMRIWWVNQTAREKVLLLGPEKELNLSESPYSPDFRFVAMERWVTNRRSKTRNKLLRIVDRISGAAIEVEAPNQNVDVVGWKVTADGMRAVGVTNRWGFDNNKPSESLLIDPISGKFERLPKAQIDATEGLVSADGRHSAYINDGQLVIKTLDTGETRRFSFHEEDRPFVGEECIQWVSPDFLKFNSRKLALINVRTMKMSFPATADGDRVYAGTCTFSPDFRWVLYQAEGTDGDGLFIAPVQSTKD